MGISSDKPGEISGTEKTFMAFSGHFWSQYIFYQVYGHCGIYLASILWGIVFVSARVSWILIHAWHHCVSLHYLPPLRGAPHGDNLRHGHQRNYSSMRISRKKRVSILRLTITIKTLLIRISLYYFHYNFPPTKTRATAKRVEKKEVGHRSFPFIL